MKYDDGGSFTITPPVGKVKRILLALAAFVGAVVYVWFAAVRAVPDVRRRKQAARAARSV